MAACGTRWLSTTSIFSSYPIWGCENSFIVCFCCGISDCHPMGQLTYRAPRELEKPPQPIGTITSITRVRLITPRQKCHKLGTPKSQLSQGWWYIPWYVQLYIYIHTYIHTYPHMYGWWCISYSMSNYTCSQNLPVISARTLVFSVQFNYSHHTSIKFPKYPKITREPNKNPSPIGVFILGMPRNGIIQENPQIDGWWHSVYHINHQSSSHQLTGMRI